jgi:hypothetical protein
MRHLKQTEQQHFLEGVQVSNVKKPAPGATNPAAAWLQLFHKFPVFAQPWIRYLVPTVRPGNFVPIRDGISIWDDHSDCLARTPAMGDFIDHS